MLGDGPKGATLAPIASLVVVVVLLATAAGVYPRDLPLSDFFQQFQIARTGLGRTLKLLGKFDIACCLMIFVCWATGNRRLLWRFVWAATTSGLFVLAVKLAVGRPRPRGDCLSFPSGDTSIAFVWAVILAAEYPLAGVPALLVAGLVGLMRVTAGRHYPSDALVGAAIGFAAAAGTAFIIKNDVPRWFYRITRRTRFGLVMVVVFLGGIAGRAWGGKVWPLLLAAVIVVVVMVPVLITKRRACARLARKPKP